MPYITQERRKEVDNEIKALISELKRIDAKEGDLNYAITTILAEVYAIGSNPSYSKINAAVGVLECAKLELYRRVAGRYEDSKIPLNGDVNEYGAIDRKANL